MKKILIKFVVLSSLVVLSSIAYCQNYDMNINLNDGSTVTFAIDDIQRIEFGSFTGIENNNIQQVFKLMQNYPNPFNPTTTIEYQISGTTKVNVSIYNLKGQLINEIINETQTEGIHQVIWNGTNQNKDRVASGFYIYTVKSDDLILSKKMLLLK